MGFSTQKPTVSRGDFPIVPVGAAICRPPERVSVPFKISAQRADYNARRSRALTAKAEKALAEASAFLW